MKRLILLGIILGAGYYIIYNRTPSPEESDPYQNEEYVEATQPPTKEASSPPRELSVPAPPPPPRPPPASPTDKNSQNQKSFRKSIKDKATQTAEQKRSQEMVNVIKNFTPQELRDVQEYYKELEGQWRNIVKDTLGENYADYQDMRKEFQRERAKSFNQFYKSVVEEHGRDHDISPIDYENQVGKAIQEKYFKKIEQRFGTETYNRYMENLQQFNREVKRHQDPSKGLLQMFL